MTDLRPYLRAVTSSSKLTIGDRLILHVLATYANEDGAAWPSSRTISNVSGMHPDVVRRCLGHLVTAGVIVRDELRTGRSTVYRFPTYPQPVTDGSQLPVTDGSHPAGRGVTARSRTCDPAVTDLWPSGHTEVPRSTKEEKERARCSICEDGWITEAGERGTRIALRCPECSTVKR